MGRGFLAGIFWGGIVGLGLLFLSSQIMDRRELSFPRPEAAAVEVPAGTEFDQARPETEPVAPEAETRPESDTVAGVNPPEDAVETPPAFDTSSLEVPQPSIDGPQGLGDTPEVAEDVQIDVTGPGDNDQGVTTVEPALPTPEAPARAPATTTEAPTAVETESEGDTEVAMVSPTPEATTEIATPKAPDATDSIESLVPKPVETETAKAPEAPAAPATVEAPDAEETLNEIIRPEGSDSEFIQPVEEITDRAPEVETDRLPRIGDAPTTEEAALPPPDTAQEETEPEANTEQASLPVIRALPGASNEEDALVLPSEDDPLPASAPALLKWRTAFENAGDLPLMSIVLVHEGGKALSAAELAGVPEVIAFGISAGQQDAGRIAADYRDAGREVVLIPSLPEGATPQDVEVALRVNFETVPEAVAVMDSSGESFQSDRAAVAQIVDVVATTGHGLITYPRGLNTAHQRAERSGVPAGLIFRDIDGDAQSNEQIRRAMDRAAFRARQDEAVILVGRTKPETLAALTEWALGNRAASVTIAPISTALLGE
ncbi:MAG: divergent polysaccharide deacetylase family protein [Boseongicola sp.]